MGGGSKIVPRIDIAYVLSNFWIYILIFYYDKKCRFRSFGFCEASGPGPTLVINLLVNTYK